MRTANQRTDSGASLDWPAVLGPLAAEYRRFSSHATVVSTTLTSKVSFETTAGDWGSLAYSQVSGVVGNIVAVPTGVFTLGICTGGTSECHSSSERVTLGAGEGVIGLPGDCRVFRLQDVRSWTLRMPIRGPMIRLAHSLENKKPPRVVDDALAKDLVTLFSFLVRATPPKTHEGRSALSSSIGHAVMHLLVHHFSALTGGNLISDRAGWQIVERFVDRLPNFAQRVPTVAEMAESCFCSTRQLYRALEVELDTTPSAMIRRHRLCESRAELFASPGTVSDIRQASFNAGYRSVKQFEEAYFPMFGEYPSDTLAWRDRATAKFGVQIPNHRPADDKPQYR